MKKNKYDLRPAALSSADMKAARAESMATIRSGTRDRTKAVEDGEKKKRKKMDVDVSSEEEEGLIE